MDAEWHGGARRRQGPAADLDIPRIVIVDDDDRVRQLLRNVFESASYRVSEARSEAELLPILKRGGVSMITLDLNFSNEDGLAIARSVRTFSDVPIIMVTARSDDVDRIVGLEIGADDYIVKPFNVREVLARTRAVLRRSQSVQQDARNKSELVQFEGFEFDAQACELRTLTGRTLVLTSAEFKLLEVFVRHAGRVLSRGQLIDLTGGPAADPLERSIDTLVGRLRKKIERDCKAPQLIKTVRGAGYKFTAKLQRPAR